MKTETRRLAGMLLFAAAAMAVPIVPFLVLGEAFESQVTGWLDVSMPRGTLALMVVGLLASDVFLPVPSSVVNTFAGRMFGFWGGTLTSWAGMTFGAVIAFGLARALGRPLARRFSTEEDLARTDAAAGRVGAWILVLARPAPVFAEASVLLMGVTRLSWLRMLVAVGASNFGIAAAYAALGDRVRLPVAMAASIALPILLALVGRRLLAKTAPA